MITVVRNFLALGSGEALGRVIAFAAHVYMARAMGAEGYGLVAFAIGVTLYLSKLADFAIEAVGTSEVAKNRHALPKLAAATLGLRLALTGGVIVAALVVIQLVTPEPDRSLLSIFLLTLIPVAASTRWIHMGRENALPVGIWRAVGEGVFLVVVMYAVHGPEYIWIVPFALFGGEGLASLMLYLKLRRDGVRFGLTWDLETALPVFRRAWPVMGQYLLGLFLYNADLLFLRVLEGATAVGYYAVAYTLISFLANIGMVYALSLLPAMAQHDTSEEQSLAFYQTALVHVFAVTLPVAAGGVFAARGIIMTAFGGRYGPSVFVLQVLIWVIPVAIFRYVPWSALIVRGGQKLLMRATFYAVVVNVILNLLFIPRFGMTGAAMATLTAEPVACGFMLYYAHLHRLPLPKLSRFVRPLFATLCMAASLWALRELHFALLIPTGALVYAVVLALTGGVRIHGRIPVLRL